MTTSITSQTFAEQQRTSANFEQSSGERTDLDTRTLFAGRKEISILHDNAVYRLRITRSGKLILNK